MPASPFNLLPPLLLAKLNRAQNTKGSQMTQPQPIAQHSHNGACVTAPLAALPDEEGPVSFATQHLLCLRAVDVAHVPRTLLTVGEGVLILHQ